MAAIAAKQVKKQVEAEVEDDDGIDDVEGEGVPYEAAEDQLPPQLGPIHWPSVPAIKTKESWTDLRDWVQDLVIRFEFLDHHVIPDCWWRHNQHVEALSALRDHERSSYKTSPNPSSAVEWIRALRDIAALLRPWTADLPCAGGHRTTSSRKIQIDNQEWRGHIGAQIDDRQPESDSNPALEGEAPRSGPREESPSDRRSPDHRTAADT